MAQIPANDVMSIKREGGGRLERVFKVIHRETQGLLCFPGSNRGNLDEAQEILQERPGIGPQEIRDVRQGMPRDSGLSRGILRPIENLGSRDNKWISVEGDVEKNVSVQQRPHPSSIPQCFFK